MGGYAFSVVKLIILALSFNCLFAAAAERQGDSGFLEGSGLDGKLRTVFYDVYNSEKDQRTGAWTAGLWMNGRTGDFADMVALGASFYGVARLEMAKDSTYSYQLLNDANEGFGKLGQAYVRLQAPPSFADYALVALPLDDRY